MLHAQVGGVPLRDDELRNVVMKVVPSVIREQLVFKLENFGSRSDIEDCICEKARILVVYGGKRVPTHSFKRKARQSSPPPRRCPSSTTTSWSAPMAGT